MTDPFYGTDGPHDAHIAIVGESWGVDEQNKQKPFVGYSGQELTKMLADAGINRYDCFVTNVSPRHPAGNKMCLFFERSEDVRKTKVPLRGLYPSQAVLDDL